VTALYSARLLLLALLLAFVGLVAFVAWRDGKKR
jgi:hypothetical protein